MAPKHDGKLITMEFLRAWAGFLPGQEVDFDQRTAMQLERDGRAVRVRPKIKTKPVLANSTVRKG